MSKEIEMFSPQKNIDDMNYDELRAFVKKFYNLFERFKREYIDTLENLDETNFSGHFLKEQNGMKAKIVATAEKIESTVSKVDLENSLEEYTKITQTADAINMLALKGVNLKDAVEIPSLSYEEKDPSKIYVIRKYDGDNVTEETYYYYNDLSKTWQEFSGETIYTVFNQTPEGFELKGNVKIDGSIVAVENISADSITSGTIDAERIDTEELACTKLYSKGYKDGYFAKVASNTGDLGLYSSNNIVDDVAWLDSPESPHCVWGVLRSDPVTGVVNFYTCGENYMGFRPSDSTMFVKGIWNFASEDTHIIWGDNAPVAIFGGD